MRRRTLIVSTAVGAAVAVVIGFALIGARYALPRPEDTLAIGPGIFDFSVPLPNGYSIWRSSSDQIIVAPASYNDSIPTIPAKVVELDHDDVFVIAKRQHLRGPTDSRQEPEVFSFWILNVRTPRVWGPLSAEEFEIKRKELGVAPSLRLHDVYDYRPRRPG